MKTISHTMLVSSFLAATVVAGLTAYPSFAEENGIDFWNMGVYQRQIDSCHKERGRLQIENEVTFRRIETKEEALQELVENRISFEEAALRFEDANSTLHSTTMYLVKFPAKNDRERAARQVIAYLKSGRGEKARLLADEFECTLCCLSE